jgi:hypothetical protein
MACHVIGQAVATLVDGQEPANEADVPPGPLPPEQWDLSSWVGVAIYCVLFVLAAFWIWRLADLGDASRRAEVSGGEEL